MKSTDPAAAVLVDEIWEAVPVLGTRPLTGWGVGSLSVMDPLEPAPKLPSLASAGILIPASLLLVERTAR